MFRNYKRRMQLKGSLRDVSTSIQSQIITILQGICLLNQLKSSKSLHSKYMRAETLYEIDVALNKIYNSLYIHRRKSRYIPNLYDVVEYVGDIEKLKGKTGYVVEIPKVFIGDNLQDPKYYTRVILLGELTGEFRSEHLRPLIK